MVESKTFLLVEQLHFYIHRAIAVGAGGLGSSFWEKGLAK